MGGANANASSWLWFARPQVGGSSWRGCHKFVALVRAAAVRHSKMDEGTCTLLAVSVEAHVRCTHLVLSSRGVRDAGACRIIYIYIYIRVSPCLAWL